MSDIETTVAQLKDLVGKFRDERDWKQFHTPKDLAVSISIEAGELLELFQWRNGDEVEADLQDPGKLRRLREEVADIVVYCLNMSDAVGFLVVGAVSPLGCFVRGSGYVRHGSPYPQPRIRFGLLGPSRPAAST